jgi:mutator protein MutT
MHNARVMESINVAFGIIVRRGKVLVCRRLKGDQFAQCWEFPGGKLEPEESDEACMNRELGEELAVTVRTRGRLAAIWHDYGDFRVVLHPFIVELEQGEPKAIASRELRWVEAAQLASLPFPAANAPLLRDLPAILRALGLLSVSPDTDSPMHL